MELEYWTLGSTNKLPGKVTIISHLFLKKFIDKVFDQHGNIRDNENIPILTYRDDDGIAHQVRIIKIIGEYVQTIDGQIYKLKGLDRYTKNIRFASGSLIKGSENKYEKCCVQVFSATGKKHLVNEDYYLTTTHPLNSDVKLLVVADGMGGYALGEEASHFLVDALAKWFKNQSIDNLEQTLKLTKLLSEIIQKISMDMYDEFVIKKKVKSGSTVALAVINSDYTVMASVGDSRIGLVQKGRLNIISIDDSPFTQNKPLTPKEQDIARTLPGHNCVTQYVGKKNIEPHIYVIKNTEYTDLFLFSDGITDCMNYSTLNRIACNIDKETLFKFITEASFGEEVEGAKGKATDDETVVHYSRR